MKSINKGGIVKILQNALSYIDKDLVEHGSRVSYTVSKMLQYQNKYTKEQKRDICFLALFHDIGAYKTEELDQVLHFETEETWHHSIYGYLFYKYFSPIKNLAPIILFHHAECEYMENLDPACKECAQMIGIAEAADIHIHNKNEDFTSFLEYLERERDKRFCSEIIDLFLKVETGDDINNKVVTDPHFHELIYEVPYTQDEIEAYLKMIVVTVDFISNYTLIHTITTTSISNELAIFFGFSEDEVKEVKIGAMLHDIGKIGIPLEILECPGRLSDEDMDIMMSHAAKTEEILGDNISDKIRNIAARHHEKLDGTGYPKKLKKEDLSLAERIVAVADVFSALYGQRSYKEPFSKGETVGIINKMSSQGLVDCDVVDMIIKHFEYIVDQVIEKGLPVIDIFTNINYEYFDLENAVPRFEKEYMEKFRISFERTQSAGIEWI